MPHMFLKVFQILRKVFQKKQYDLNRLVLNLNNSKQTQLRCKDS